MADWSTIASLSTAGGTLVLAVATFSSVRSANRAARVAETSLLAGLRPLLVPSRLEDPPEKVGFADSHWMRIPGGQGVADVTDEVIYLGIAIRNVGSGIAVLDGWSLFAARALGDTPHADPTEFRRLTRDIYVPPSDQGFWQGALRDQADPMFTAMREVIEARGQFTVDVLYRDYEGGQRMITRFSWAPRSDEGWIISVGRHWNLDRPDPR